MNQQCVPNENDCHSSNCVTEAQKRKTLEKFNFQMRLAGEPLGYSAPKVACVYALEMSDNTVKIGVTRNLENRIKEVSGAVYLDVLNVHSTGFAPFGFMRTIESRCHAAFSDKRVRGEFFDITFAEACAELDSHAEEIAAALKKADEDFIAELSYWEELTAPYKTMKSYFGNKKVMRISVADDKTILAVVDELGFVQSAREFTNSKDAQSAADMIYDIFFKFCGEKPPEGMGFLKKPGTMHFVDFVDSILAVHSDIE